MKKKSLLLLIGFLCLLLVALIYIAIYLTGANSGGKDVVFNDPETTEESQTNPSESTINGETVSASAEGTDTDATEENVSTTETFPAQLGIVEGEDDGNLDSPVDAGGKDTSVPDATSSTGKNETQEETQAESTPSSTDGSVDGEMGIKPGTDDGGL